QALQGMLLSRPHTIKDAAAVCAGAMKVIPSRLASAAHDAGAWLRGEAARALRLPRLTHSSVATCALPSAIVTSTLRPRSFCCLLPAHFLLSCDYRVRHSAL